MILRVCQQCHKEFYVWPFKLKDGKGLYCSKGCAYAARKGRPMPWISQANKGKRNNPSTEFKKGSVPWNKGLPQPRHIEHHNYRTGKGSYRRHLKRLIPYPSCSMCGINLSWPKGTELHQAHIHHVNHDRTDGRIENLIVICTKCHNHHHKPFIKRWHNNS